MTTNSGAYGFERVLSKLKARAEMMQEDTVEQLEKTGEEAINTARATGNYKDRTGNLRNSIGYQLIVSGNPESTKTTEGTTAAAQGYTADPKKVSTEIEAAIKEYKEGADNSKISLVIVAGMRYGLYLEKNKGYNVLNTAVLTAKSNFSKRLAQLRQEFIEDFNKITGK